MTATTQAKQPGEPLSAKQQALLRRLLHERTKRSESSGPGDTSLPAVRPDPSRRDEPFPLTEIQRAYWIGRSDSYELGDVSIHIYLEVDGADVDLEALQRAWQQLVARHDMLRAVVLPDGRQRILPTVPAYEFRVDDLRGQPQGSVDERLAATREELSHQVLDLEQGPCFEIRASLLEGSRTRLHISIDLLHLDAGSLMILFGEWMRRYRDPSAALPPLELSYRDYVLGTVALQGTDAYQRSADYWRERVTSIPPAPQLPVAHPDARLARTRFHHRTARLEPEEWRRLKARAAQLGLTPSAVLLTAYAEVLASWCRETEFTVNVTLFNRLPFHPEVNSILGDFTSMILVETAAPPDRSFADRSMMTQKELWVGLENRYLSGIEVLRELARARHRTSSAAMPVVFTSLVDLDLGPLYAPLNAVGDLVFSTIQTPQVSLDYQVAEDADGSLLVRWDTVDDLFPPGLIDDMFAAHHRLVRRLAQDDDWQDPPRSHLPPAQLEQRAAANATSVTVPPDTLRTRFLRQAALRPDAPAVVASGRTLTYGELLARANRLGRDLQRLGAEPDTLVAVVLDKGWEQAVAVLGVHAAGAAYLPVDPALPTERRDYLFTHGEVRIAVTTPRLDAELAWPAGLQRVRVEGEELPLEADGAALAPAPGPENLSHVIYTSGSTGAPKGVMIEHRSVVNRILDVNQRLQVGPNDRVLALTALSHDLSVYDVFGILAAGGALVVPDPERTRDPAHWAELMVREHVTFWNSVPAYLQMLVEYLEHRADRADLVPRSLRCVVMSGDWIPVDLPDRLRALVGEVAFIASGGPTETTIWDVWNPVDRVDPAWRSIPYGKPMNNTRYHVLDNALEPCPVWVPGELCIAGAGLARGYWRDQALSDEVFITHPRTGERIYRSGDLGRYLPDGNIEFLGREDLQVKVQGYRVELGEVEAALRAHPAVAAAVVTAVGERTGPKRLVAYVVPKQVDTAPAAPDEPGATIRWPTGVTVVDPVARIDFKLDRWGIRRDPDREAIPLARATPDDLLLNAFGRRRTIRGYSPDPIRREPFGAFLEALGQVQTQDGLPKFRYPSGGSLYPVQTYLYLKPGRVEGIPGGVYYYHPVDHRLVAISPDAHIDEGSQLPHNRGPFREAAFAVFLVGQLKAVEPMYGEVGRDFCVLEAGYMSQLLMTVAPAHRIGLCPIGAMDFPAIRHLFDLDDGHILAHVLLGGAIGDRPDPPQEAGSDVAPERSGPADLAGELRDLLERKLPRQLRPSTFVLLDELPLSANGKVDRRALPAPERAPAAEPAARLSPRNEPERIVSGIVREVLHVEDPGVDQNFFDLGGNSLHMVQILNHVCEVFQREIRIGAIFRHPSIGALAAYLSGDGEDETALVRSGERAGGRREALAARGARRRAARGIDEEGRSQR